MAYTQEQINAALAAELSARPNTSAYDLAAYAMQTYGITPAQIDRAYQSLNVSALPETIDYETNYGGAPVGSFIEEGTTGYTGASQKVTDPNTGKQVELIWSAPGFNPTDPTTLRYLGEQNWRDPNSYGSTWYNNFATPAQKATADALWSSEWKKLNAQDVANEIPGAVASGMMPKTGADALKIISAAQNAADKKTGLLSGQAVQADLPSTVQTALVTQGGSQTQTDAGTTRKAMEQSMENIGVKKTYTDAEMKQALRDLSYLEPNASVKDIISAAATYGISKDKVIEHLSSFTYTTKNVDKLAKQILAQNTTATWKGDVKPDQAARYMADELAKSGITDISQVGRGATGIINKETGQKLISGYGERTKGNLWSGTYEGGGNTGFGVQFTDDGKPMFYTEGASSSTLKKDLLKAAIVAGAALGIAGPEALSGIFGSSTAALTGAESASFATQQLLSAGMTQAEVASFLAAGGTVGGTLAAGGLLTGGTAAETAAAKAAADAAAATAATAAGGLTASQLATAARLGLTAAQFSGLLTSGGQTVAGLLQQQTSKEAADKARAMIDTETAAAKASAAFKPVGMTTRFGTSEFKTDPVTGQITSAGYTLSPEAKYAQDFFRTQANLGLQQVELAPAVYAPLKTGANMMFDLGQQALNQPTDARLGQIATDYLTQSAGSKALQTLGEKYIAQSPEEVAQNYLNQQMALLQPGRELELANLQNKLQQQGRGGLAVAQGGALGATTPELQALYNARATQEAQLAAGAQQAGQQQVQFGAGLFGTGQQLGMQGQQFGMDTLAKQQALDQSRIGFGAGLYGTGAQTLGNYYGGLAQSYAPYNAAFGQMQALETAGQQPFTLGAQLGQTASTAGAKVGQLGLLGAGQSVELATGKAATTNPYATALGGVTSNPLFTDALTKIAGGTPVNALDFGAYGSGNTGFQKMIDDIYG
jgi:hypothetical protein